MSDKMKYVVRCPVCKKSMVYADKLTNSCTSHICWKCKKAFIVNWKTLTAVPAKKIKIES